MTLRIDSIQKKFKIAGKKKEILSGIDLEIRKGEVVSLTGRSGCGKTTLLNIVAGLVSPDRGRIYVNDKKMMYLFDTIISRRRNREIGLIYQTFRLMENETVLTNVYLPARLKGSLGIETRAYADEILGRLKIYTLRKTRASLLSGGQKQRVAIARALINRPSVVLADEPTANLDNRTSVDIFNILDGIRAEGTAVLIVTHKDYMHRMSDRVYTVSGGVLKQVE